MSTKEQGSGSIWNPNSWHWQMKNYTEISKKILEEKFLTLSFVSNGYKITHTKVKFPKAEAEINIRKGKQFLVYEYELDMETHIENEEEESKGSYRVKQILHDDLNDMIVEDVKSNEKNRAGDELKKWVKKNIKEKIIGVFREMQEGLKKVQSDPKKLEEDKKKREQAVLATEKAREEKGIEKERLLEEQRAKERKMKEEAYKTHFQSKGQK